MRIYLFMATLLAIRFMNTKASGVTVIGEVIGGAVGGVAGGAAGTAVAGPAGTAFGGAAGAALGAAVGGAAAEAVADAAIAVSQSKVPDRNIPFFQDRKSMVEPWLSGIRSRIEGMVQTNTDQHRHFADFIVESFEGYMEKNSLIMTKMQEIHNYIDRISLRYQRMQSYKNRTSLLPRTLTNFAVETLQFIHTSLDELHITVLGNDDRPHMTPNNLLVQLDIKLKSSFNHMCRTQQSAHQFFYLLHEDIAITELKALALAEFSWSLLRDDGEFTEEKKIMREDFDRRTSRSQRMFSDVMSRADRTVWRCDPVSHIRGVTYDEVTRLLQGYIDNEKDLHPSNKCYETCADYKLVNKKGSQQDSPRCSGKVIDCQFVESDMEVCQAASSSTRRYEFIHYESGHRMGKWNSCGKNLVNLESWYTWWFYYCSYCMCLCDEQSLTSDRFFNLRPVTADVERNRVVTGLRFVKHNRIFHLQIQEGELLPLGVIDHTTVQWKPVEEYRLTDRNLRQNIDYHMLTYDRRAIDLNELQPQNNNSLITGLRFQNVGGHLHLEAKYTAFEFQSGKLIEPTGKSYWTTGSSDQGSQKLPLANTHVSTRTTGSSIPLSNRKQYIHFTHTGFDQDAAQTTVPFIDIQDVVSSPPVPLSGIGIYYKGRSGYGGFLGPMIVNFDFTPYL